MLLRRIASSGPDPVSAARGSVKRAFSLLMAAGVGMLVGLFAMAPGRARFDFLYTDFTLGSCLKDRAGTTAAARWDDLSFCWDKLRMQGLINDFQIRKVNFLHQHVADIVILWMVVILTLSGVLLAGFQIIATTQLRGETGYDTPSSELLVQRDKIFLRSSVTGLFILIVSFAFFFTYVMNVYTIKELGADSARPLGETGPPATQPAPTPPAAPLLNGSGGLGPRPK